MKRLKFALAVTAIFAATLTLAPFTPTPQAHAAGGPTLCNTATNDGSSRMLRPVDGAGTVHDFAGAYPNNRRDLAANPPGKMLADKSASGTITDGAGSANFKVKELPGYQGYKMEWNRAYTNNWGLTLQGWVDTSSNHDVMHYNYNITDVTAGYQPITVLRQPLNRPGGNSEYSTYELSWTGGVGNATYVDPAQGGYAWPTDPLHLDPAFDLANNQIEGLDTSGEITNGGTFKVYNIRNRDSRWAVTFPPGATDITVKKSVVDEGTAPFWDFRNPVGGAGKDAPYPMLGYFGHVGKGESYQEWIQFHTDLVNCEIPQPAMTLTKTASTPADDAKAGSKITYAFTQVNTGNTSFTTPKIIDPLCDAAPTITNESVTTNEVLDHGETITWTCEHTLTQTELDHTSGTLINKAKATGIPADNAGNPSGGDLTEPTAEITTDLPANPLVEFSKKTTSTPTKHGQTLTYTFEAKNTGNVTVNTPAVTDDKCAATPTLQSETGGTAGNGKLDVGETMTFTCTSKPVTRAEVDEGKVDNTATFTGTPTRGTLTVPPATKTVPITQNASMTLVKTSSDTNPTVGQTLTYNFTLVNTGNVTISNVKINDAKCDPASNPAAGFTITNENVTPNGHLEAGETITGTCQSVPVTQAEIDAGKVDNNASATGAPPTGVPLTDPTDSHTITVAPNPGIQLAKSTTSNVTEAGQTPTYTFKLTNTGNVSLTSPGVTDPKCAATPTISAQTGGTADNNILDVGETITYTCTSVPVTQAEVDTGKVINTAIGSGTPPSGVTITDSSTATVTVDPTPAWSISKAAATAPAKAGDTITYNFTVVNTGNVSITPTVTDPKCATTITLKPETSGTRTGVLEPGETQIWTCDSVPVTQAEIDAGEVINTVKANGTLDNGDQAPKIEANHTTTITADPKWALVKTTASQPTAAGQTLDYTFKLTNTGNVTIKNPGITDAKCFNTPVMTAQTGGTADNSKLDVGETITYTCTSQPVTQAEVDAGVVTNTASATGTPTGGTLADVTAQVDRLIQAQPAFTLAKATNSSPTTAGETLDYTFTLTNTGNVTIFSPAVTDAKCAATPAITAESVTPADEILQVGETITFSCTSIPVTQTEINAGSIANSASASGTPAAGDLTPVTADLDVTVTQTPKWAFVKSTGSTPQATGDTLTYRFTIINQGNVTISNPVINDAKCASGFTPALSDVAPGQTLIVECDSVPVTDADVNAGSVDNSATLDGTTPTGTAMDQLTSTTSTPIAATPSFTLTKSAQAPLPTKAGETVGYVFTLVNSGNVQINSPSITDGKCAATPTILNETRTADTNLEIGETITFTCTSNPVTQAEVDAGFVDNSATATGTPVRGTLTDQTATHQITIPADPATSLTKAVNKAPTAAGDILTYTFDLTNTGNVTINAPTVTDAKCDSNGAAITAESVTPADGILQVGETITFTCTSVPVEQTEIDTGVITNTATGSGTPARGTLTDSTASITTTIDAVPAFTLTKAANEAITAADETPTYTFTLTNTGNVTINSPTVTDQKCDATGLALTNESITQADNVLEVGETNTYMCTSIPVTQTEVDAGQVVNTATASGTPARGTLDDVTADHTAFIDPTPNMTIVKTANTTPLKAGDTIDYTFVVQNTGNVTIGGVSVTDAKCASAPTQTAESQIADGQLSPGEFFTFTCTSQLITQTEVDAGIVHNEASANGNPVNGALIDPTPTTTHDTPVPASPAYSAAKTSTGAVSGAGDTLTYQIAVTNTGNVTIDPLVVTDPKCNADPTLLSESMTADGRLEVGETMTYECVSTLVTQGEIDAGKVTNTATVTGTPARGELEPLNPTSTQTIEANPSWTITKSSPSVISAAGETATYQFAIVNTGNVTITGVNVTDAKCASPITLKEEIAGTANNNKLDVGETHIYECESIPVTQTEIDAGKVLNTATANGTPAGGTLPEISDDHEIVVQPAPKWTLAKTSTTTPSAAGESINYRFTVVNNGNVTISNVDLTDAKCATAITMVEEIGGTAGNSLLDPGEIQVYECDSVPVTQAEVNTGFADNTVNATGIAAHGDLPQAVDDHRVPLPARPNWTLAKAANATPTQAGDTVEYAFTLTNTGNIDITDVNLADPKCGAAPALTANAASADAVLSPGEIWQYTCTSRVLTQTDVDSGTFPNTATATGTPSRGTLTPTEATVTVPIEPDPSFALVKTTNSEPENAGDTLTYRFELTNTGNVTINDPKITDDKCANPATIETETATTDGALEVGETITFTCASVPVTQTEVDTGLVTNTATATGTPAGGTLTPVEANHEKPITAKSAWKLHKAATTQPNKAGDTITYRFTLVNTGNVTITDPKIADPKCANPATIETESAIENATLEFGETMTFTCVSVPVTQAEVDAGIVVNTATATGNNPNGPMEEAKTTHNTDITALPSFNLIKNTDSTPAKTGDTLTYSFELTNTGNVTITDPKITDAKCANPATIANETATTDGVLEVGETITFTCVSVPVTQTEVDTGVVTNTATATGTPAGGTLKDVTSTKSVPIDATPAASLTKVTNSAPQRAGDRLLYTFIAVNKGNVTLNDPTIKDPKCASPVRIVNETMTADSTLEVGETIIFECDSIPVTQQEVDSGKVDNVAELQVTPTGGSLPKIEATTTTPIPTQANWEIAMTTDTPIREVGTTLEYEFTILNTGNTTLSNVELTTTKCAGPPTLVSGNPNALEPLQTLTYKCTSTPITQQEIDTGNVPNKATATADTPDGTTIENLQTSTITPAAKPDQKLDLPAGKIVEVEPLTNDAGQTPTDPTSLGIIDPKTGKLVKQLRVPGEGIWIVKSTGAVVFRPETSMVTHPTPVRYEALTTDGKRITSTITITYVKQGQGQIQDETKPNTFTPVTQQPQPTKPTTPAAPAAPVAQPTPQQKPQTNLVHTGAESQRLLMWACMMISIGSTSMAAARRRRNRH